jgi:hypothetical protein
MFPVSWIKARYIQHGDSTGRDHRFVEVPTMRRTDGCHPASPASPAADTVSAARSCGVSRNIDKTALYGVSGMRVR